MRLATVAVLTSLVACAPPKIDLSGDSGGGGGGGEPTIRITHPFQNGDIELNADCSLSTVVAVDVDNIVVVQGGGELVEGQGHWHVEFLTVDVDYTPVPTQLYKMERPGPFTAGSRRISATLTDNQHTDLDVAAGVSIVEFNLTVPAGATCP